VVAGEGWQEAAGLRDALVAVYGRASVIELDAAERAGFAGNCIALREGRIWMSERAADTLSAGNHARLEALGFRPASVALDEIEKAGGSLRCCVAEIF
jgi:N-dimethylarginine dimethylaminohydrolase